MPSMGPGTHRVKILSTVIGESSKKKTPQIEIRFENTEGEHITYHGYFSQKALPYTLKTLDACGWDKVANDNDVAGLHDSPLLVGNEVEVVVEMEDGQDGNSYPRVRWVNSLRARISQERAAEIGASLKSAIAQESSDSEPDLSDIPF